jgi:hypothetical protein
MTHGQFFARVYAPALLLAGAGIGAVLANSVDNQALSQDFWKETLKIVSLSAIPLAVLAMRAPFAAGGQWRRNSAIAVITAFAVVVSVVGVCLNQIAPFQSRDATPATPADWKVWAVCIGTGLTVAALALGVVLAFFVKEKETAPLEPPQETPSSAARA